MRHKSDKIEPIDLEPEMVVWVKEFNDWVGVNKVYITSGRTSVLFDNGKTLTFDDRRRFKEYQ